MQSKEVQTALSEHFSVPELVVLHDFLQMDNHYKEIGSEFRLFDLKCLLSTDYIKDQVLEAFQHKLITNQNIIFFVLQRYTSTSEILSEQEADILSNVTGHICAGFSGL